MSNGKRILITGAGRGIGREIALKLSDLGFQVSGCARSEKELAETRRLSGDKIRVARVDVRSAREVEQWIESESRASGAVLWGLVTAAGIHGDIAPFIESDWTQWTTAIEVNLYGTALCCKYFARKLLASNRPGRIVLLSGGGATQPIENLTAYCASKAAVVRFGETLAVELKSAGITVNSIAPGAVNTAITETIIQAGPEKAGKSLYEKTLKQLKDGGTTPDKASNLAAYLMTEESAPVTGKLISAVWDPWPTLHTNAEIIENKDMYALRRTVPPEQK